MAILKKKEFERQLQTVEARIRDLDKLEEAGSRRSAVDAVQALLELHGAGLESMLHLIAQRGEAGEAIIRDLAADEMVGGLLLLHGLHPESLEERIRGALVRVRPYLGSHGGNVELIDVSEGVAHLRLEGTCKGCPSSTMTLKYAIEREIAQAAPDLVDLVVDGVTPPPKSGFIPLTTIKAVDRPATDTWRAVAPLDGGDDRLEARDVDGVPILLCRLGATTYAYQQACPFCVRSLEQGRLEAGVLECGDCGHRFDVKRAGQALTAGDDGLRPIPLLEEDGRLRLAVGALAG